MKIFDSKTRIKFLHLNVFITKIGSDMVTIDPLTLFLRLVMVVEKNPEDENTHYFKYELSPYLMSFFKDSFMRSAEKAKFRTFLL